MIIDKENNKIYGLFDPITNELRYIGITFTSLEKRLKFHLNDKAKNYRTCWIKSLKAQGLKPLIQKLVKDEVDRKEACRLEKFFIKWCKENGYRLINGTSGGDGGYIFTDDVKKKMSASAKGKVLSDETKRKIGEASKGRKNMLGKIFSKEHKRKISETLKGRRLTEEHRKKISEAKKNISSETKKKISESKKGKSVSEEHRKKISEAHKGKKLTQEHRKKISETLKKKKVKVDDINKQLI